MVNKHLRSARVTLRMGKVGTRAFLSTKHPILVHMIPMRRCNLSCVYCNEYDKVSPPVPTEDMFRRVDHLASLKTSMLTLSGGEPMLHPDLDQIIERTAKHGIFAELLTNAYLLTVDRIKKFNDIGLARMQISIDNVNPDDISKKSLKVLDSKLKMLSEHAEFGVNINSVLGAGIDNPEDAYVITKRGRELGFTTTVGIIHDGNGHLRPLGQAERDVYNRVKNLGGATHGPFVKFKENLAAGKPNDWRCRAGARYLYICEDGLVHYCSQQRGFPGTPLLEYGPEQMKEAYSAAKPCAPFCTITCVHAVATFDNWRHPQTTEVVMKPHSA